MGSDVGEVIMGAVFSVTVDMVAKTGRICAMEPMKLPVLRLASLPASARYRRDAGDNANTERTENALPSLPSPSRAALLLFKSAPSASTASLASTGRPQFSARRLPREQPEDFAKTPLERATEQLQASRERAKATLARLVATQTQFAHDESQLAFVTQQLQLQQQSLATLFARFFDAQARQIQRAFRGHRGRRVFRQLLAVRAVLTIQRAFRASRRRKQSRRKKLRLLCRKVLRGLRGVNERHDLAHHELLNRVNHNMLIETQWRHAMGIDDAESDLMTALYRKRYIRRRLGEMLRRANTLRSIVTYWQRLIPQQPAPPREAVEDDQSRTEPQEASHANNEEECANNNEEDEDQLDEDEDPSNVIVIRKANSVKQSSSRAAEVPGRPELRRRQRVFTRRVQEENQRREAAHSKALDRQKEQAQLIDQEAREMEEQRRRERARAMQPEMERRGLLAIKELQAKKEREERERQAAEQRAAEAKRAIAAQVLSPETQQRLRRQQQRQQRK